MIEEKHIEASGDCETLGPSFFAARDVCEQFFKEWEPEHLNDIAKQVSKIVSDKLHEDIGDFIWEGTLEDNLHSRAYRMVDDTVEALLTGQDWAVKRYVLNDNYGKGERLRAELVKLIPKELQDKRISDLEGQLKAMTKLKDEWVARVERRLHQY